MVAGSISKSMGFWASSSSLVVVLIMVFLRNEGTGGDEALSSAGEREPNFSLDFDSDVSSIESRKKVIFQHYYSSGTAYCHVTEISHRHGLREDSTDQGKIWSTGKTLGPSSLTVAPPLDDDLGADDDEGAGNLRLDFAKLTDEAIEVSVMQPYKRTGKIEWLFKVH
uniref:Uncharacterized protein n=1 Tax=Romanomermis culicivorax TaxID=13658 RepID=A0A915K5N0_ROMCU